LGRPRHRIELGIGEHVRPNSRLEPSLEDKVYSLRPVNSVNSSINLACSTRPAFASGRNFTSRSISLSGCISPLASDPRTGNYRTPKRLHRATCRSW